MTGFDRFLMMLINSHKSMQKLLNETFSSLDIKCTAVICLRIIHNSENGLSAGELTAMSGYDKALISRNCSELKERGLIEKNPDDSGILRGYRLVLTEKGRETIVQMDNVINELTERITEGIPKESLEVFFSTSSQMTENIIRISK